LHISGHSLFFSNMSCTDFGLQTQWLKFTPVSTEGLCRAQPRHFDGSCIQSEHQHGSAEKSEVT
jgi:hypothetical protein